MNVQTKQLSDTKLELTITADATQLGEAKQQTLEHLAKNHVKMQGFRSGKAPLSLVEKQVDPNLLQSEFLENAVNRVYVDAAGQERIRPVAQPTISILKFVPFTDLEIKAEVEVVGKITLPDYSKITVAKTVEKVAAKDVTAVLENLAQRTATKKAVKRAAKLGDEVLIDFFGTDAKTKEPITGADGKAYPLQLGSGSFIPGFEDQLVGVKAGEEKTFDITFPKDYGAEALQNRKVQFACTVHEVKELQVAKLDDVFAKETGPFQTLAELKADIKKQLEVEKQNQAERDYENALITQITEKAKMAIPTVLVDEELDRIEQDERQNLAYRGQTWKEHLEAEGVTEEEHRERNRAAAELRVKGGLVLSEISARENLEVSDAEIDDQIVALKQQYTDPQMQAELDKPSNRRELAGRIMSEKTIGLLKSKVKPTTVKAK